MKFGHLILFLNSKLLKLIAWFRCENLTNIIILLFPNIYWENFIHENYSHKKLKHDIDNLEIFSVITSDNKIY